MNPRYALIGVLALVLGLLLTGTVSAATNVTIDVANNSEYNSSSPTIMVTCWNTGGGTSSNTSTFNKYMPYLHFVNRVKGQTKYSEYVLFQSI